MRRLLKDQGLIILDNREYNEIREKVQLLETIIDGENMRKTRNKKRLSLALSTIRSIQSKYFHQPNYSMYYFRHLTPEGKQPLNRQNYRKWKKLKDIAENSKIPQFNLFLSQSNP